MRLVFLSDTHGKHEEIVVPEGDILIHAGDLTVRGKEYQVEQAVQWLHQQKHPYVIFIAGNHDFLFEDAPDVAKQIVSRTRCIYLQDSQVEIGGIKFYGSPHQPRFYDWAFNLDRGEALRQKWELIPPKVDVLITHGPPLGHGDVTLEGHVGCTDLLNRIREISPILHVYGHIHEGYGLYQEGKTVCLNASICGRGHQVKNSPIIVDFDPATKEISLANHSFFSS